MSCEGSQGAFFAQRGGSAAVASAFGGTAAEATAALEQIFATARAQVTQRLATSATTTQSRAAALKAVAEDKLAELATRALFAEMQALGLKPPTHSTTGLPKKDAQYGYAAIRQTLQAITNRTALPALAQQVREAQQRERTISAVNTVKGNLGRCTNCGQFAGVGKAHICPQTTSGARLQAALMRRLGVPDTAYDADSLQGLIDSAKNGPLMMRHNLTGEQVGVTLDGLAVALRGGFVPNEWRDHSGLTQVQLSGSGAIVPVLNATNLNTLDLRGASGPQQAAAAYGQALAVSTVPLTATALPLQRVQQVLDTGTTGTASLQGAQEYDIDHFIGTEFRKRNDGSYKQAVTVAGQTFKVGDRLTDRAHFSSARTSATKFPDYVRGEEPLPKTGNVGVGRTLLAGIGILNEGEVVEVTDTQGNLMQVQVYDADRRNLLAVYDPRTHTAGETGGTTNASPAQMAAIIAYRALHPQNGFDTALAADLSRMNSNGSPVAAADSAYIAIKNNLFVNGGKIAFGGQVGTQKCPDCGQFMGAAHNCPTPSQQPAPVVGTPAAVPDPAATAAPATVPDPATAAPAAAPEAAPAPTIALPAVLSPEVTVTIGPEVMQPIADALRNQPAPQVNIGPEAMQPLADALRNQPAPQVNVQLDADALAAALKAGQQPPAPVTVQLDSKELAAALKAGQQSIEVKLDAKPFAQALKDSMTALVTSPARSDEKLAASMDRLAAALSGAPLPTPATSEPVASAATAGDDGAVDRQPRAGGTRPDSMPPTAVEHILRAVRLPAPDPYLSDVPTNVGGQRRVALREDIPAPDPNFEVNEQTERILRVMSASLQAGAGKKNNNWSRAFSVYGPPGTGKNTLARQLAASVKVVDSDGRETQGMSYAEVNVTPEMSLEEAIGTTILTKDPQSGATISQAQMGKIGLAAAMGSVICINEIVRNPKLATALQSMLEDGEIQINSPEAGLIKIPVHPSTVFVMTWNPGLEGDAERPAKAPLERTIPLHLGAPTEAEQARRVDSFFSQFGDDGGATKAAAGDNEKRRQEILAKDYTIDPTAVRPSEPEKSAAIRFFSEVNAMAGGGVGGRQVGLNSAAPTGPGLRQLNRFIMLGKTVGWDEAKETLRICCDQDEAFADQWDMVKERFAAHFGDDGLALNRKAQGKAAQIN